LRAAGSDWDGWRSVSPLAARALHLPRREGAQRRSLTDTDSAFAKIRLRPRDLGRAFGANAVMSVGLALKPIVFGSPRSATRAQTARRQDAESRAGGPAGRTRPFTGR
jgi:hypothetical protein